MLCSNCAYSNRARALACAMCGKVLRRDVAAPVVERRKETRRLTAYPPAIRPLESLHRDRLARKGWVLLFLGILSVGSGLFLSGMTTAEQLRIPNAHQIQFLAGLVFGALGVGAILARSRLAVGTGFCLFLADTAVFAYVAGASPIPHLLVGPVLVRVGFLCYWTRG